MLPKPIKEGPVEIKFEDLGEKLKVFFIITFNKDDMLPGKAAGAFKSIVQVLRTELDVSLSELSQ